MNLTYHLYVSEQGNVFMTEIASLLAAGLGDLGYETVYPARGLPEPGPSRVNLVVAPHEFYPLQRGHSERALLKAAAASVAVGVEQPGTNWFELGARYASMGPIVLDISQYAVDELIRRGHDAHHLQLGYHPSFDRWKARYEDPRPIDVLFLGSFTKRREALLAQYAGLLWDCTTDIRLFEFPRPMSEPRGNFVTGREKLDLLASSRLLLNLHRDDVPYFEWIRVLEAVSNGCLVVTESSTDYGPLLPGKHLIAAPAGVLGAYAASVANDEDLRSELANEAYDLVRTKLELTTLLEPVCAHVEESVLSKPSRGRPARMLTRQRPPKRRVPTRGAKRSGIAAATSRDLVIAGRLKELLDAETELVRKIEALQSRLTHGSEDHVESFETGAWSGFRPQVSVVITSFNYQHLIGEAIGSVVSSPGVASELVIVDDHSQDDSVKVILDQMASAEWFPIKLLAKSANSGLGTARNVGIAEARADRVFILDADNVIYPRSLEKLSAALDRSPDAAFSYGVIDTDRSLELKSHLSWDVRRLTECNYIDAMAMIRRQVWDELGGYDPLLHGWEDYEFWLHLAARGLRGEFVPEFVGHYRVHSDSMLHTVNIDTAPLVDRFRGRYPHLPWDEN